MRQPVVLISRHTAIEDLLAHYPGSVKFFIDKGLPCLVCGEPTWGTLEDLANGENFNNQAIDTWIEEVNNHVAEESTE